VADIVVDDDDAVAPSDILALKFSFACTAYVILLIMQLIYICLTV